MPLATITDLLFGIAVTQLFISVGLFCLYLRLLWHYLRHRQRVRIGGDSTFD